MTIDERLEALTQSLELQVSLEADAQRRHEERLAHHDHEMAEFRAGQERLQASQERLQASQEGFQASQERLEASQERLEASQERLEASHEKTEAALRRAIRLAVLDARRQRRRNAEFEKRNQEFDEKMTQIASAQLRNEELLKAFLERGGNGKH
jgi:hypothetical protein